MKPNQIDREPGNHCPNCGERITSLERVDPMYRIVRVEVIAGQLVSDDETAELHETGIYGPSTWTCPECQSLVAENEEQAIAFLTGQKATTN